MVRKPAYKRIKKDYQRQKLRNPFFGHKPKGNRRRLTRCLVLAAIILLMALIWFFFASPVWRFKQIIVNGLTRASSQKAEEIIRQQADNRRLLMFKQANIFLFDQEDASEQIKNEYNLVNVAIKKKIPGTLIVTVQERPYAFIFQEGDNLFHASADAYIIREPAVQPEDKAKYFIVENKTGRSFIGDKDRLDIKESYLSFVLDLGNQLAANSELPLEKIIIDQEFNMATAKLLNGPAVYFSAGEGTGAQIERLLLVKREEIKDNFSKTNYIDLRYGAMIFVNPEFK
jgi:hypothetical protein